MTSAAVSYGQYSDFNHPELDWYTLETVHFQVHYHAGAERTAQIVAKIAEDIFEPVTSLYGYKPDGTVHFIVNDYDDNSNGAAFYYDNKVEIWAPQMTFILRGTHNWLRNVVTHEFTHIVSLGAARKLPRRIPAIYFQLFGYEAEKRPDVLYGYPNLIVSYPISMTVMPMWLAEGMAQYQAPGLDYDKWDSHRDMLIRTAIMSGQLHSLDEMGVFGKNSLGNERTYNAGYAFVRYICQNWGSDAVARLSASAKSLTAISIDGALHEVTGLKAGDLYDGWRRELATYYSDRLSIISQHRVEGKVITQKGIANVYPRFSLDGKMLAFCGSPSSDYLTLTNLILYDIDAGEGKTVKSGVNSKIDWSADGKKLLYARRRTAQNKSLYYDLHIYNLDTKQEKRLTHGLRAVDPAWSPDKKKIACITQNDGTDNLTLLDGDGHLLRNLTGFHNGEGLYSPNWSMDGKTIVFSQARHHDRDIKVIDVETGKMTDLIANNGDARDPVYSPDGENVYFSWDKTGIFNIYSISLSDSQITQWTNVTGGAFMPDVSPAGGHLSFSLFRQDGYKISLLKPPSPVAPENAVYAKAANAAKTALFDENEKSYPQLAKASNYDDTRIDTIQPHPYKMTYGQLAFLPRFFIDSTRVKLGTYFYASDILNKYSVLGGFAINTRKDIDAYALFEFRKLAPTLFLELYGFTRNLKESIEIIEDYPEKAPVDINFNILEADLGTYYNFSDALKVRAAYIHSRYTSKIKDFFFQGIKWQSPQNTYFIGNHFAVTWSLNMLGHSTTSDINPSAGRRIWLNYTREYNKFFKDFATDNDYGTPQEVYSNYNYNRLELRWNEYVVVPGLKHHALGAELHGGLIDRPVDSFFNFFAGSLPGLRGYPFYSIEGRKLLMGRFSYRFPIFSLWQKRFLNVTMDKMFFGFFFDYGNAFDEDKLKFSLFKKDVGVDLRFALFSFYSLPTALSFQAAYGLDRVSNQNYIYGKEWRYYFTLLFDFDLFQEEMPF
jgi:hypothetical protein